MKKYNVYKNNTLVESYARRYEAEEAINRFKHDDRMFAIMNDVCVRYNIYDIRRAS